MLFPTSGFLLFFLFVAAAMVTLETRFTAKKTVLVVASYYFYAQWDWRFCFLLAFSTGLSYAAGLLIAAAARPERQRLVLGIVRRQFAEAFGTQRLREQFFAQPFGFRVRQRLQIMADLGARAPGSNKAEPSRIGR